MKRHSLLFMVILMTVIIAACGETEPPTETAPVREPTLSFEERITYSSGRAENPLQMVIRPVKVVETRLYALLAAETGIPHSAILPETLLRDDLGLDERLADLNPALQRDFSMTVDKWDAEDILTVADLLEYVQERIGEQVSRTLFRRTGLYIDLVMVEAYGDALYHLCDSDSGVVSVAWLDGITYTAAVAQSCGEPGLQAAIANIRDPEFESLDFVRVPESTPEVTPEATAEVTPEATPEATAEATPDTDEPLPPTETPAPTPTTEPSPIPEPEEDESPEPITPTLQTGERGVIVVSGILGAQDLEVIRGRPFCRLGYTDFYSWFLPTLVMAQEDIDLQRAPSAIVDYPDTAALIQAVRTGECAATGLSQSVFDALDSSDGLSVAATTIEFPFGVFMYPLEVGLGVRLALNEHLALMAQDPTESRPLRLLLGQDAIFPVEEGDFAVLAAFMQVSGYDFAQLGE